MKRSSTIYVYLNFLKSEWTEKKNVNVIICSVMNKNTTAYSNVRLNYFCLKMTQKTKQEISNVNFLQFLMRCFLMFFFLYVCEVNKYIF